MRWPKLVVVAGLVMSSLGCIQLEASVALRADGGGSFHTHLGLGKTLSRMMGDLQGLSPQLDEALSEGFGAKLSGAQRDQLADGGVTDVVLKTKLSKKATTFDMGGTFASLASLEALATVEPTAKAAPEIEVLQHPDGTYEAVWKLDGKDGGAAAERPKPDVDPEKLQKLLKGMGDVGDMMAEATTMSLAVALEVPGEVVGVEPDWGKVEGQQVRWTLGSTEILAATSGEKPPPFPDVVRVRFLSGAPIPGATPAPPVDPTGSDRL